MKLKVLHWNIWIREDPKKVALEVLRINPDIICAQELKHNLKMSLNVPEIISKTIKYDYFYKEAVTWDNREDITSQGNAIFSKFPIIETNFSFLRPFKHNPPNATKEGRVYVEVLVKAGRRLLTLGTTHLTYAYKFRDTRKKRMEADRLVNLLKDRKKDFIFTGDLNATPKSYVVEKILKNKNLINAGPDFSKKTWTTKPFNYHGFKEDDLNWRIDYVFTSKDVEILTSNIIETKASDHLPILIELEV